MEVGREDQGKTQGNPHSEYDKEMGQLLKQRPLDFRYRSFGLHIDVVNSLRTNFFI